MTPSQRKPVIITFKPKDQRPDKTRDKLEIVSSALSVRPHFFNAATLPRGFGIPPGTPAEVIGYDVNLYEAPIVTASLTDAEVHALTADPNVAAVEDDHPCYALHYVRPRENWVVEGQPTVMAETIPAGVAQIKAPTAWECSRGKAIKVAILDTGIDASHPDLAPNYRGGISFVPTETTPTDYNGHGTHVAGTVAAATNGAGVVGVAPSAYLYAVKVLDRQGSGNFSWIIAGIDWCIRNGVRIVNMSLGGPSAPGALETMCNTAWSRGVLLVAAAGNDGGPVGYPARYASVVAVSAIDSANAIAPFSNRGAEVELCAPGVNVLSTSPGGTYRTLSGTSMATPHVSGVAALAWGSHRYSDNITIRRLLAWTADNLGVPGRDSLFGYGRVDAEQAACELAVPPAVPGIP